MKYRMMLGWVGLMIAGLAANGCASADTGSSSDSQTASGARGSKSSDSDDTDTDTGSEGASGSKSDSSGSGTGSGTGSSTASQTIGEQCQILMPALCGRLAECIVLDDPTQKVAEVKTACVAEVQPACCTGAICEKKAKATPKTISACTDLLPAAVCKAGEISLPPECNQIIDVAE